MNAEQLVETIRKTVDEALEPLIAERDELKKAAETRDEEIEALRKSVEENREILEGLYADDGPLAKFGDALGSLRKAVVGSHAVEGQDGGKKEEEKTETSFGKALIATLPARFGGSGRSVTLE